MSEDNNENDKKLSDNDDGYHLVGNDITSAVQEATSAIREEKNDKIFVSQKDLNKLKNTKYEQKRKDLKNEYVLQNLKTGTIVSLRGNTPMQAISFIGWRPRQVKILSSEKIKES